MPNEVNQNDEWVDIDEAMRLTGASRRTLMRWRADGKVKATTREREFTQRQRRILFKRSDLLSSETS